MPTVLAHTESRPASPSIEAADQAAAMGEWTRAIAIWEQLIDSPDCLAATRRIRWFLDESSEGHAPARIDTKLGPTRKPLLLAGFVCALAGTACVFAGQETSGASRVVLASLAWILYIATATLVVAYAFASGSSLPTKFPSLTGTELQRARQLAARQTASDGRRALHR